MRNERIVQARGGLKDELILASTLSHAGIGAMELIDLRMKRLDGLFREEAHRPILTSKSRKLHGQYE